mmetsp:Transcript_8292/g.16840  ORF Transcript_8292/g.16840 Transcript_8292/m.16840 type:complete len:261 (-) Transcript_8292:368-1150(-)
MFRNSYDTDITVYSPQGRLHQVEYAMEAVKQGSAVVGLRSGTHVVLATLKRASSELSANQKKLFQIDEHMGIAIAGLTADARVLSRFLRMECLNYKFNYGKHYPASRAVLDVANKCQKSTQIASKRPFGVGLLVAAVDETGPHLYQTCPSGNYFEFYAMAIGSRSQSAKTYLERTFQEFEHCSLDELCKHAMLALRETVSSSKDTELQSKNTAIAFVGKGTPFTIVENEDIQPYLDVIEDAETRPSESEETPQATDAMQT